MEILGFWASETQIYTKLTPNLHQSLHLIGNEGPMLIDECRPFYCLCRWESEGIPLEHSLLSEDFMDRYKLEIKQIMDYPRCRIYREFVQQLIKDRNIALFLCKFPHIP